MWLFYDNLNGVTTSRCCEGLAKADIALEATEVRSILIGQGPAAASIANANATGKRLRNCR
jgi:hypothetical protein